MGRYDREVTGMFTRLCRVARSLGMDTSGWYLQHGSPSNGKAWRLLSTPGGSCVFPGLDRGYLGWTGSQARDTLHALAVGMETAAMTQENCRACGRGLVRIGCICGGSDCATPQLTGCVVCGRDDVVDAAGTRCSRHVGAGVTDTWERSQDQQLLADLGEQNYG